MQANAGPGRPTAANDGQRRPTQAHEDKKGPNDASGVVWASGIFLSIFFLLFPSSLKFLCYLVSIYVSIYVLHRRRGLGGATKKKTGPNDARCVVWAIAARTVM